MEKYSFKTWGGVEVINSTEPQNTNFGGEQTIGQGQYKVTKLDGKTENLSIGYGSIKSMSFQYCPQTSSGYIGYGRISRIERI